ncbi:TetR/AcrR family transcriptional regulator [Cohnella zeiphila]|uniref:TetR/AcrR family transcriptional regulator n=1 Tax=Cohnella zeiphila TaxID=2761120 RepID=A0A7X0SKM5_9BACL|nr:TetR/AcrR family transcriptional regulator [Cohnella zeiphila]MBB6731636.1 TetR/AcrR family transcriptional regulator [Cohnella zeiphila]
MDSNDQDQPVRKRARGMSVEERRAMIVQAALPLLAEVGPSVTTLQIARAAGISEPTIFRAFADKNEVLQACLEEVTDPEHIAVELNAIDTDSSLEERLVELIEAIQAQGKRTGAVLNAIRLASPPNPNLNEMKDRQAAFHRKWVERYAAVHAAVCGVLEPDEPRLRISVSDMATLVLSIVFSLGRNAVAEQESITTKQLADLLLNGALKGA